jgi:hypothetical protein
MSRIHRSGTTDLLRRKSVAGSNGRKTRWSTPAAIGGVGVTGRKR